MNGLVLVTGAAGFIGSNIAAKLMQLGYVVHGCDDFSFGSRKNIPQGLHMYERGFETLDSKTLMEYETIIHCATSNINYAMEYPIPTFKNNSEQTIEFFRRFSGKIIYTSTCSVYGQAEVFPTPETAEIRTYNAYDTSKRIAELYLMSRKNYTTLRLSNVYGRGQRASNPYCGVLGKFISNAITRSTSLIYGVGDQTRDYTYIDDVVDALVKAVKAPSLDTEINIATGEETSVIELLGLMPVKGEWQRVEPRKIDLITRRQIDNTKAKLRLGWTPQVKIRDGILKTYSWYLNESDELS